MQPPIEALIGPTSLDERRATTLCVAMRLHTESYSGVIDLRHLPRSGFGLPMQVRLLVTRPADTVAKLAGHGAHVALHCSANRKMTEATSCGSVMIRHDHDPTQPLFIPTRVAVVSHKPYLQIVCWNGARVPISLTAYLEIVSK